MKPVFNNAIRYHDAKFLGEAVFDSVRFNGNAAFHGAVFEREVNFENAKFTGAMFNDVRFELAVPEAIKELVNIASDAGEMEGE